MKMHLSTRSGVRAPLLFAMAFVCLAFVREPRVAVAAGERIRAYDIEATIDAGGSVLVRETMEYDFGTEDRHGIYRDLVTRQRYDDRFDRWYEVTVRAVSSPTPNTPTAYQVTSEGALTHIRIGDPDRTITGVHTYVVVYEIRGTLNGFPDHDEWYWNVIGDQWPVPIERVTVSVRAPQSPTRVACFAGPSGVTTPCARAVVEGGIARFAAGLLDPFDAVTVVVALPKGAVAEPEPLLHERRSMARAFTIDAPRVTAALLLLVATVGGVAWALWRVGRDRQWAGQPVAAIPVAVGAADEAVLLGHGASIPVEYTPPEEMRPGLVGTVLDETAHPLDVSATVVDLAVRGFLRIEEIEGEGWFSSTDWRLTRLKPASGLSEYETLLLDGLFRDGDEVKFSDLRQHFAERIATVQTALYRQMLDRGWYRRSPEATRAMWLGIGLGSFVLSVALTVVAAAFTTIAIVPLGLLPAAVLLVAFHRRMPARTAGGTAVYRRVQGFRRFILDAETYRARFAEEAGLFYDYLPYAIVFGATKQWARAFEGLATPAPDWYVSSHPFTTLAFAGAMSDFTDRSTAALTSTPGGSGGSGFSGGFSGGGGGGGGGGSW